MPKLLRHPPLPKGKLLTKKSVKRRMKQFRRMKLYQQFWIEMRRCWPDEVEYLQAVAAEGGTRWFRDFIMSSKRWRLRPRGGALS